MGEKRPASMAACTASTRSMKVGQGLQPLVVVGEDVGHPAAEHDLEEVGVGEGRAAVGGEGEVDVGHRVAGGLELGQAGREAPEPLDRHRPQQLGLRPEVGVDGHGRRADVGGDGAHAHLVGSPLGQPLRAVAAMRAARTSAVASAASLIVDSLPQHRYGPSHNAVMGGPHMAVQTTNPYLEGAFAPVEEEVTAADLAVVGSLPRRARRPLPPHRTQPDAPERPRPGPAPLVRRRRHGPRPAPARRAGRVVPQPVGALDAGRARPSASRRRRASATAGWTRSTPT